jgi:hypothetical protein
MQLSAANLLLAAQQALRPQPPQAQAGAFSAELSAAKGGDEGFSPLAFKQTSAPAPQPTQAQTAPSRPGATLDIRI